jgi:hypothetical protein
VVRRAQASGQLLPVEGAVMRGRRRRPRVDTGFYRGLRILGAATIVFWVVVALAMKACS